MLGAALAWAGPARAQAPAADSAAVAPSAQAADTTARHPAKKPFFSSPTGVMFRSLLIPGWGQATNGSWIKAGLVAGGEIALATSIIQDTNKLKELDTTDPQYSIVFNNRQQSAWWLGGLVFLSMVDAYVDAHLKGFDVQLGPEPSDSGSQLRLVARIGAR